MDESIIDESSVRESGRVGGNWGTGARQHQGDCESRLTMTT